MTCPECEFYYSRIAKDWDVPIPKECFECGKEYKYQHFSSAKRTCDTCVHGGSENASQKCLTENRDRFMDCFPPSWKRWEKK